MPRRRRFATGGYVFHVLNRAAGRKKIFETDKDYSAFTNVLEEAGKRVPIRLLSYCVMPNHWHLAVWPRGDDDLSEYMRWLTVTHTQRYHAAHQTSGAGPLYQGRFKSFPVEDDDHFIMVGRYIERNALRARLVTRAELWRWSSLWQWVSESITVQVHAWPVPRPGNWTEFVNRPETEEELVVLRNSVNRGTPYGAPEWQQTTVKRLGLESTFKARGRPKNSW